MLALASLLERLREDPGTIGKRYQIAVTLDPWLVTEAERLPGVAAVGERYSVDAADSFRLGEPVRLIAYPGDHTEFEAPPLAEGRRIRGPGEIEVGVGLADALGLRPGSVLAAQMPDAEEVRFRVVGIVRALEHDGRIGWVQPDRLLAADPGLRPQVVVRVSAGADPAAVTRRLVDLGAGVRPGRRRADRQRRVPGRARRGAARRRVRRRPGVPVRARPGLDRDRARAPRRGRRPARQRRRRPDRRPRPGRRGGGRRDPRRDRGRPAGIVRARPARGAPGRGLRVAAAGADRRADRARRGRPGRAGRGSPRRWSPGACCASRSSRD